MRCMKLNRVFNYDTENFFFSFYSHSNILQSDKKDKPELQSYIILPTKIQKLNLSRPL